jgi:hypothetical protein
MLAEVLPLFRASKLFVVLSTLQNEAEEPETEENTVAISLDLGAFITLLNAPDAAG